MIKNVRESLGYGATPFDISTFHKHIKSYASDRICLIIPDRGINFYDGVHHHDDYEIFVCLENTFPMRMGNRRTLLLPGNMLIINPGIDHGASFPTTDSMVMSIFVEKGFMDEVSANILGYDKVPLANRHLSFSPEIRTLIDLFIAESLGRQAGFEFILEGISSHLVISILRQARNSRMPLGRVHRHNGKKELNSEKMDFSKVIEFVMDNLDRDFSLNELAGMLNMSTYHFIKAFKVQFKKSPLNYFMDMKIGVAMEFLKEDRYSVTEVGLMTGFSSPSHFSRVFKKKTGLTPTEFLRKC